jgi:regulator of sigma E protease
LQRWAELQERVSASPGADLPFEVFRGGRVIALTLRPEPTSVRDPATKAIKTVGRIGAVGADVTVRVPMSTAQSFTVAGRQTWLTATKIVDVVRGLITREVSVKQLGGPIAITRASVAAAQSGLESLFLLIALLSVNVAVLNLLPIPILDGGQILLNVAEAAKGSPFSARTREYILRFGLVAILLIFALSTFNDVKPWIMRMFS